MKKVILALTLIFIFLCFPSSVSATQDFIPPTSKFYFLQTWLENIQLSLKFSSENKLNYLLTLTDKRVEEMKDSSSPTIIKLYENHYQYLDKLSEQMENKEEISQRIRENSLRQQAVLAGVYEQVPDQAKEAILGAQENSSKHVARTVERVEGTQAAKEYTAKVEAIQQLEKAGQIEQLQMEASPNANPGEASIKEIKGGNPISPGQDLNVINEGKDGGQGTAPGVQIQMNAPAGQN
jgi:hypothetical protein